MAASELELPDEPYALRARWIFPVDGPPIPDGVVSVEQGRIAQVGTSDRARPIIDLGNAAILPGLVNAHTHLEFSDLQQPLGVAGMTFPEWIREVMSYRRRREEGCDDVARLKHGIVACGANECVAAGTTTLGEITTTPIPSGIVPDTPLRCAMFHELIGLSAERVDAAFGNATDWLEKFEPHRFDAWPGLSPHAPYSVSLDLLDKSIRLSAEKKIPLAMHLAESVEELELLASHSGPLVELLTEIGFWNASAIARGLRPLDFLKRLKEAHRVLVIHGNYLDSQEISLLGRHADRMSVVHCPRTHAYFDHGRYPLAEMLDSGVRVALGTDSRASNPNLSLLDEIQFVVQTHPEIPLEKVLEMGTASGAAALGLQGGCGTLTPGKWADFCIVGLSDVEDDPHALLLDGAASVRSTVLGRHQPP